MDPVFHIIAIFCYVTVAIVHFVLPQLRDMVGNIITTMCVCLIVAQAADTCRIFTEFTSPVGFLVAGKVENNKNRILLNLQLPLFLFILSNKTIEKLIIIYFILILPLL